MFGDVSENVKLPLVEFGTLITVGPQNGLYKPQKYYQAAQACTPIVRVDAFGNGCIADYSLLKRLHCTDEELTLYGLQDNDLIFNRVNGSVDHVGKCAVIRGLTEPTVFESNIMRVRCNSARINIDFLITYLCSDIVRGQIKAKAHIANQASVNQNDIRSLLIPLPAMEKQREYALLVQQADKSKFVAHQATIHLQSML